MTDADPYARPTVVPPDATLLLTEDFDGDRVTGLRHAVAALSSTAGLTGQPGDDFVLAVNELLTNAVRHGGGRGRLRLWREADSLVCEISDSGGGIGADRLSSRARPAADTAGGWGLWLARQLTDRMTVRSSPAGTTVRISSPVTHPERAPVERTEPVE